VGVWGLTKIESSNGKADYGGEVKVGVKRGFMRRCGRNRKVKVVLPPSIPVTIRDLPLNMAEGNPRGLRVANEQRGTLRDGGRPGRSRVPGGELFQRLGSVTQNRSALANLGLRTADDVYEQLQKDYTGEMERKHRRQQRETETVDGADQPRTKRRRTTMQEEIGQEEEPRRDEEQQEAAVQSALRSLDEEFAEKELLSNGYRWCEAVPDSRKISTVREFYTAFHSKETMPISTCMICYRKFSVLELQQMDWNEWVALSGEISNPIHLLCRRCFVVDEKISACRECLKCVEKGFLSAAAQIHTRLGCEHMFPEELKDLTPIEEKLIALNSCYGFITRYSLPQDRRQTLGYPKHVKGHITVFPNHVQELVTNVLPHPLIKVLDDIHVSWQGREKPTPKDVSALLSVRRRVVERALRWLKLHNHLYTHIEIDMTEMETWGEPLHGVPRQVYERLERNEPSAHEKARTGQIVPAAERDMEEDAVVDIQDVLVALGRVEEVQGSSGQNEGDVERHEAKVGGDEFVYSPTHEFSSSGMFGLNDRSDIADAEKMRYVLEAFRERSGRLVQGSSWNGHAEVRREKGGAPYILLSRGQDYADTFDTHFFSKTFPILFPTGRGGPLGAQESLEDLRDPDAVQDGINANAAARNLVLSRDLGIEKWAGIVLQRHGGRFATHYAFAFLVFNIGVKSRNRRVSMASVQRKDFEKVESLVRSLSSERCERARAELEASGKTADEDVNRLLRHLSLYGFRQPMSRELRLKMRRKIKSLVVRHGVPAIWFTLNPNDITNPVKLRLAAYRSRNPAEAEAYLMTLDEAYKRARLAVSDPLSSALFFHREISMFFKHYVKVGEESVFGRVCQYFGAVETNDRGALHIHGLLWLHGNMTLAFALDGMEGDSQVEYREKLIEYVDSVFTEVSTSPVQRSGLAKANYNDLTAMESHRTWTSTHPPK